MFTLCENYRLSLLAFEDFLDFVDTGAFEEVEGMLFFVGRVCYSFYYSTMFF